MRNFLLSKTRTAVGQNFALKIEHSIYFQVKTETTNCHEESALKIF